MEYFSFFAGWAVQDLLILKGNLFSKLSPVSFISEDWVSKGPIYWMNRYPPSCSHAVFGFLRPNDEVEL